jgi:hypothetical protein
MNRTQAFLAPALRLEIGVPVIDSRGYRGVVVDKVYRDSSDTSPVKVRVCRINRYTESAAVETYDANELRVDLTSDLGFVYALRQYLKLVNAEARQDTLKIYVWTWGKCQEQVVKWWASMIDETDEAHLMSCLMEETNTLEH